MNAVLEDALARVRRAEAHLADEARRLKELLALEWEASLEVELTAPPPPAVDLGDRCSAKCHCQDGIDVQAELAALFPGVYPLAAAAPAEAVGRTMGEIRQRMLVTAPREVATHAA